MSVVDFSKWNSLEWWERAGYKSRDEAWADFMIAQSHFQAATEDVRDIDGRFLYSRRPVAK